MDKSQLPGWATAEEISNRPDVHEALQGFSEDPTGDNGVCVVRAILAAAAPTDASLAGYFKQRGERGRWVQCESGETCATPLYAGPVAAAAPRAIRPAGMGGTQLSGTGKLTLLFNSPEHAAAFNDLLLNGSPPVAAAAPESGGWNDLIDELESGRTAAIVAAMKSGSTA